MFFSRNLPRWNKQQTFREATKCCQGKRHPCKVWETMKRCWQNRSSPHWRVGFLFLVLYPLLPPALLPHHSLTHLTHTHSSHSLTHSRTHALTHSRTHARTHPPTHPLTHSLTHSFTHSHTHSLTIHTLTHSLTHVRPGVPWVSASFAWQAWDNVHCQGVACTPHVTNFSRPHMLPTSLDLDWA